MSIKRLLWLVISLLSTGAVVSAQDNTCPMIVNTILQSVEDSCAELGRNQVCYGNNQVAALDFESNMIEEFDNVGDTVDLLNLASLATAPLNIETNTWGVALMVLQANLPETLPGQNVTFVVFGDTELNSQLVAEAQIVETLSATSTGAINLRSGPSTAFSTLGTLASGDVIELQGRNANADWVQIVTEDGLAWVFAPLLTIEGDVASLAIINSEGTQAYDAPMQAFTLQTGIGTPNCNNIPPDGVLVQAPTDTTVHFLINGIEVKVGSTAFIETEGSTLQVHNLNGDVSVTSAGTNQDIPEGFFANAREGNIPSNPVPYDFSQFQNLPIHLLPESFAIPVAILSDNRWVDTGIMVEAGDTFDLIAGGVINFWDFCEAEKVANGQPDIDCDSLILGPDGGDPVDTAGNVLGSDMSLFPVSSAPPHSLVGRIGSSTFFIGTGGTFTAAESGRLEFRTNDVDNNNLGAFIVATILGTP